MHQINQLIKILENDKVLVGLRADKIVHVFFKDNTEVNIALQDEMVKLYEQLCEGKNIHLFLRLELIVQSLKRQEIMLLKLNLINPFWPVQLL